jgi:hypothetical protein
LPERNALNCFRFRLALLYVYFVLGIILVLPILPVKKMLMDHFKLQPSEMAILFSRYRSVFVSSS